MKRFILTALLATLGWLGTMADAQAQNYNYTYDPFTRTWVMQTYYTPAVIPASNVVYTTPAVTTVPSTYTYYDTSNWGYYYGSAYQPYVSYNTYYTPNRYYGWRWRR